MVSLVLCIPENASPTSIDVSLRPWGATFNSLGPVRTGCHEIDADEPHRWNAAASHGREQRSSPSRGPQKGSKMQMQGTDVSVAEKWSVSPDGTRAAFVEKARQRIGSAAS